MSLLDLPVLQRGKDALSRSLPASLRATLQVRGLGLFQIPLIFFVSPTVVEIDDRVVEVRIPLGWRTKNHLGAMYFGALAVGADVSGGLIAWRCIAEAGGKVSLIFKDFQAEYLKRAEGDVHFRCEEGEAIAALVRRALESGERENLPVHIVATVPKRFGQEPVAKFTLTLSLKKASKKRALDS